MVAIRLTPRMKAALERLREDESGHFAAFSTATALESKGLVRVGSQQTGGKKAFPEYWITLTKAGRAVAHQLPRSRAKK